MAEDLIENDKQFMPLGAVLPSQWGCLEMFLDKNCTILTKGRVIASCFLMTFTGLRINEVRLLRGKQIKNLALKGETKVLNIKNMKQGRIVVLLEKHREELKRILLSKYPVYPNKIKVIEDMEDDWYLVHNFKSFKEPLKSRAYFNRLINKYLKAFAEATDEKDPPRITSHSFRKGIITHLHYNQNKELGNIAKFIGHKNVQTTFGYTKSLMTPKQLLDFIKENPKDE